MGRLWKRFFILLLIVFSVYWGRKLFFPTEEEKVLNFLSNLEEAASFDEPLSYVKQAAKATNLGRYFSSKIKIAFELNSKNKIVVYAKKDLLQKYMLTQTRLENFILKLKYPEITIKRDSAEIIVTMVLEWTYKTSGENNQNTQKAKFILTKEKGVWVLLEAKHLPYRYESPNK